MKQAPLLQAKKLAKSFRAPAPLSLFTDVTFAAHPGETVAISGRSGQGKSTLLNILGTLEPPSSGSLEIVGNAVGSLHLSRLRNEHLAFVFQSYHLLEEYTALDNILMPARIARKDISAKSTARTRAWSLLEQVGLTDRAQSLTKQLSGGEKQRIALARALCNSPDILFADEPTGNLDQENAKQIEEIMLSYARDNNKCLIIVTHDLALASRCDTHYSLIKGTLRNSSSSSTSTGKEASG